MIFIHSQIDSNDAKNHIKLNESWKLHGFIICHSVLIVMNNKRADHNENKYTHT